MKVGGVMEDGDATQKECEDSDNNGKCCKREKRVDGQSVLATSGGPLGVTEFR